MISKREVRFICTCACNYDCIFCHHEGAEKSEAKLNCEDIIFFYDVINKGLGIDSMTITGGEPLLRSDIYDILTGLKKHGCKLTLITNGSLIWKYRLNGIIDEMHLSIHSVNSNDYESITCSNGYFDKVIKNIGLVKKENPNVSIIINYVLLKGLNDSFEAIYDVISLSKRYSIPIKFIEFYPVYDELYVPIESLEKFIDSLGYEKKSNFSINRKTIFTKGSHKIETTKCFCSFAERQNNLDFCNKYNDLFLNPDGCIQLCRKTHKTISIITSIKSRKEEQLLELLNQALSLLGNNCPCVTIQSSHKMVNNPQC